MKSIIFYDNYNEGQDVSFIVGDRLYDILKTFCLFHTKRSECKPYDAVLSNVHEGPKRVEPNEAWARAINQVSEVWGDDE